MREFHSMVPDRDLEINYNFWSSNSI